jgi:hypothetical protein
MQNNSIRPRTVKLLAKFIKPLTEEGIVSKMEEIEILSNLKQLAEKGSLKPAIAPKLIHQKEAAEMLGIGLSNFKKLETEGVFIFKRRMIGSAVRYRNTDIINFIMSED